MRKQFGKNVRFWREKRELSHLQLHRLIEVENLSAEERHKFSDIGFIERIEHGEDEATLETAEALATVLNIEVGELFR